MSLFNQLFPKTQFIKQASSLMFANHLPLDNVRIDKFCPAGFDDVKNEIANELNILGFQNHAGSFNHPQIDRITFWKRRNININRSVILLEINHRTDLNDIISLIHQIKFSLGKVTGYIPFLNEVGMQIIVIGDNIAASDPTFKAVDTYSNQRAIIQSLFIIDKNNRKYYRAITVMQTISAEMQALIDKAILNKIKNL